MSSFERGQTAPQDNLDGVLPNAVERPSYPGNFDVLTRAQFVEEFAQSTAVAQDRVWLRAMNILDEDAMQEIEPELVAAAGRGLDTRLVADHISLLLTNGAPTYLARFRGLEGKTEANRQMFERLGQAGVQVDWMNPPSPKETIFPYTGRNHQKLYFVDGVGYIGGSNLETKDINDFMVRVTDPVLVSALEGYFGRYNENGLTEDENPKVDDETTILVDSGTPGGSVIYDTAIELIDQEENITFVSQVFPEGKMMDALIRAHKEGRGVHVYIPSARAIHDVGIWVVNRRAEKQAIGNLRRNGVPLAGEQIDLSDRSLHELSLPSVGQLPITLLPFFVHTKAVFSDKRVITGSHNYSWAGVKAGTEEIALDSTNPVLIRNVREQVQATISKAA